MATGKDEQLSLLIILKSWKSAVETDTWSALFEIFHGPGFRFVGNRIDKLRLSPLLSILYPLWSACTQPFCCSTPLILEIMLGNRQWEQSSQVEPWQ